MALKQKATTKILYSMGEVCEMFDLPPSTIRFWGKNFPQLKPKKNAKGNRLFTPDDIDTLKVIYHLVKEKGMTLAGANQYIKDSKAAAKKETNVVELLQKIRATLVDIRTEINSYEKQQAGEIIIKHNEPEAASVEVETTTHIIEEVISIDSAQIEERISVQTTTITQVSENIENRETSDAKAEEATNDPAPKSDSEEAQPQKPRYYEPTLFDF